MTWSSLAGLPIVARSESTRAKVGGTLKPEYRVQNRQRHGERVAEAVGMPLRGLDRRVTQQRGDAKGDQAGRHSIRSVLASLAEGATTAEILADFPTLSEDDVREDLPMPELPIKR